MGVIYKFLRKNNHSKSQAVSVITVDNLLGVTGYVLIIAYIAIFLHAPLHISLSVFNNVYYLYISIILLGLFSSLLFKYKNIPAKLHQLVKDIFNSILEYKHKKQA